MARHLTKQNILLSDYTQYVDPLREEQRQNSETLAAKNNIFIEFVRRSNDRKEDVAKKNYDTNKFDLVAILSAMSSCNAYKPWHDKVAH